jgi:hypothetical protein
MMFLLRPSYPLIPFTFDSILVLDLHQEVYLCQDYHLVDVGQAFYIALQDLILEVYHGFLDLCLLIELLF